MINSHSLVFKESACTHIINYSKNVFSRGKHPSHINSKLQGTLLPVKTRRVLHFSLTHTDPVRMAGHCTAVANACMRISQAGQFIVRETSHVGRVIADAKEAQVCHNGLKFLAAFK